MTHKALYREWRPLSFNDVVEQDHVTKTLKKSVMANRVAHAYLFTGTRGTGKTSMALILARAINCLNPQNGNPCNKCEICTGILSHTILDVIEIDAASNNSVENIRTIREEVMYTPSVAKFKVYIIDEVHMLSTGAFNALLKTLEEPPSHVIFILATTEPHKLPATILSRCQRYDFHRISVQGITDRLNKILKDSGFSIEKKASKMIARIADGALRNAINLLDQCISLDEKIITVNTVLECAGIPNDLAMEKLAQAIFNQNVSKVLEIVSKVLMEGKSSSQLLQSILYYFRNLLICKNISNPEEYIECTIDDLNKMKIMVTDISSDMIAYIIKELSKADSVIKKASQPRTYLEVVLINICTLNISRITEISMLERISALERKINNIKQAKPIEKNPLPVFNEAKKEIPKQKEITSPTKINKKDSLQSIDFEKVIKVLRDENYIEIYPYLLGSNATIKAEILTIYVTSTFNKDMIINNKNNISHISEIVKKVTGNTYTINFALILDDNETSNNTNDASFEALSKMMADELGTKIEFED